MSRLSIALAAAAAVLTGACYKVTVVTTPSPAVAAAEPAIDKEWNHSFVYGLVAPKPIDAASDCKAGVSKVVTQRSFLNGLVGGITYGIYTPLQVQVACAGNARSSSLGLPPEMLGKPAEASAVATTKE